MSANTRNTVIVVGGGVAGFAAAVAAASLGAKVTLLEKSSRLGGNAIQSNVGTICGAFYRGTSPKTVGHPFLDDVLLGIKAEPMELKNDLFVAPYQLDVFENWIAKELQKHNVDVQKNTEVVAVHFKNEKIESVTAIANGQKTRLTANAFVDASGCGLLSDLANLPLIQEENYQPASQVFRVENVASNAEFSLNLALQKTLLSLRQKENLPPEICSTSVVPGSLTDKSVSLKFTLPSKISDRTEQELLNESGTKWARIIFQLLQANLPSFSSARLAEIYPQAGIRVRQRAQGDYVLQKEDVLSARKHNSSVAKGTWPIEVWQPNGKVEMTFFAENDHYEIPAECLKNSACSNLFFAGKNISATGEAIASARVIGTCLQTGFAAGEMAAATGNY